MDKTKSSLGGKIVGLLRKFNLLWNAVYILVICGLTALVTLGAGLPIKSFLVIYFLSLAFAVWSLTNFVIWWETRTKK